MYNKNNYKVPKSLDPSFSTDFLRMSEEIFSLKQQNIPNVVFDLRSVRKTGILGLLLIYKFVEFTVTNKCFFRPLLYHNPYIKDQLEKYRFWNLLESYMNEKPKNDYNDLEYQLSDGFFIAPMPLLRSNKYTKNSLLPQISSYYSDNEVIESIVLDCLNEVLLNFWEHAVDDSQSILVAKGNKNRIEIACADTGNGIISTLAPVLSKKLSKENILLKALQRNVTSKLDTNHMGCGLWIVNQLVSANKGHLNIFSEGAFVNNRLGKITNGRCAFWQGTIVYLSLPLTNPIGMTKILEKEIPQLNRFKINFTDI